MLAFETLVTHSEGPVLFAEINRPPLNLLGTSMVRDLVSLIRLLEDGDEYRVVVFSSALSDFFIAHVDVTEVAAYRREAASLTGEASLGMLFRRLSTTPVVTIAQVEGRTRGAGSEFVLACDLSFASLEGAVFGQIEGGVGMVPGAGAVQHLARSLGRQRALEVLLGAEDYDARQAEHYGWINRALPATELRPFVSALAHRIARFPKQAIADIKSRVNAAVLADEHDFRIDSELFGAAMSHPTVQRRMGALVEQGLQRPGDLELHFGQALATLRD